MVLEIFKRFLEKSIKTRLVVFEDSQLHVARLEDIEELVKEEIISEGVLKRVRENIMNSNDALSLADLFAARYPDDKKIKIVRYADLDKDLREKISEMYSGASENIRSMHDKHLGRFRERLHGKYDCEIASSLS